MYTVDIMVKEHENIMSLLAVIKKACCNVIEGGEIVEEDFRTFIDFARNYADKYHHGKEEDYLFNEMAARLGKVAENLITHGMLVEHEIGRGHIMDLEMALDRYKDDRSTAVKLDIVEAAAGYANLLIRHIEKENAVVFTYGANNLPEDIKTEIDDKIRVYEESADKIAKREKYLGILKELRKKYGFE